MYDGDIVNPAVATQEKPLAHWLVVNITPGMMVTMEEILSYRGSMPPTGETHRYVFVLYKQNGTLVDVDPTAYTPECSIDRGRDR